jgi:membrane-associated phospholipid phosphatase
VLHPRHWDTLLLERVGRLPATPVDRWLRRLSTTADHGKLWALIGAVLALRPGQPRRAAVRGLGSMAVSSALVNAVVKRVFGRVRPDRAAAQGDRALRRVPHSSSFPSGHSASAAAFATGVALESPATGALIAPLALGVGYSRVHVGVHYPGDVLAGMALGCGVALASRHWRTVPTQPTLPATDATRPRPRR